MPRKIVFLAGTPSHGADYHEYEKTAKLFKVALEHSNVAQQVVMEYHTNGWPEDESTLENADLIVVYSDGRDGDLYQDVPFVTGDRMNKMENLMKRGCGLMLMHFSTFFSLKEGERILEWVGGYFEWEDESGKRNWYSRIDIGQSYELAAPNHPIATGVVSDLYLNDEVYYKLRFKQADPRLVPIGRIPELADAEDPLANVVAWAVQREDGGRGFGTTLGHAYRLWKDENYRKMMLNAIVWTAGLEVPSEGVQSRFYSDRELEQALKGITGPVPSRKLDEQIHVLLLSGNEAHKWHQWETTAPAIVQALQKDSRIEVDEVKQAEELALLDLSKYDAILLNYCNWMDPNGLSEAAKENLLKFLENGGGLSVLHFANGAFHYSLPEAGASDWPEYRKLVPRIWNHHNESGHDEYGTFTVQVSDLEHPISEGIPTFTVEDELYFHQEGDADIHVLYYAHSKVTGEMEPMVWFHQYKAALVFQSLLGHSAETYSTPEAQQLLRRGVLWSARRSLTTT